MAMGNEKKGIRRQFLQLMFLAALLSFAALSAVLLHSMYRVQNNALESGRSVGEAAGEYTESLAENHAKQKLLIDVTENAHHANQEIADIAENTTYIALTTAKILSNPDSYLPRTVLNAGGDSAIHSGDCYMIYGPDARGSEDWDNIVHESRVAANIADTLEHFSIYYSNYSTTSFFISENNYMLCAESFPEEELIFPEGFLEKYNPTQRRFYREAKEVGDLHTRTYMDSGGYSAVMCSVPVYVEGKMVGIAGIGIGMASLYHDITSKTVGSSGINFALNQKGEVVFSSEKEGLLAASQKQDLRTSVDGELAVAAYDMTEGGTGVTVVVLDGKEYYLAYAPMPVFNWSMGSLALKSEVVSGVQTAKEEVLGLSRGLTDSIHGFFMGTFREMAISMALIFIVIFFLSQFAADRMVRPLLALTRGVDEIAGGNLNAKLDVRTGDELEELSDTFNQMTDDLKLYIANLAKITEEKEQIQTELNLARGIQVGLLPDLFPKFADNAHYDLYATMDAARQVGGDFYDFYMLDDEHLAVTVADVSGKGIPAALFMVISKTILKNTALAAHTRGGVKAVNWGVVMEQVNRQLCANNEEMMFVTVFFGFLNIRTGEFTYVNGGHNPPLIGRARGETAEWSFIKEEKKSHMVGVIEDAQYEEKRLTLSPGDMLYFYTDGVTEAMDEEKNLYTEERLQAALTKDGTPATPVRGVLEAVRADVDRHACGAEQSDDITMLGLRYLG